MVGLFNWFGRGAVQPVRSEADKLRDELLIVRTEHEDEIRDLRTAREHWRELALEAIAELKDIRLAQRTIGIEAVPGVDPKTTRDADAERFRQLRERTEQEGAA